MIAIIQPHYAFLLKLYDTAAEKSMKENNDILVNLYLYPWYNSPLKDYPYNEKDRTIFHLNDLSVFQACYRRGLTIFNKKQLNCFIKKITNIFFFIDLFFFFFHKYKKSSIYL